MSIGSTIRASLALAAASMAMFGDTLRSIRFTPFERRPNQKGRHKTAKHKRKDFRFPRPYRSRLSIEERFRKTGSWNGAVNGDNQAGTKLARKARRGIVGIRKGW